MRQENTHIVTIGNQLVKASYTLGLTEKRILMLLISKINNQPERLQAINPVDTYSFSVSEYADTYNLPLWESGQEIKDAMVTLYNREVITQSDNEGNFARTRWFSYIEYGIEVGTVKFIWATKIIPYISELRTSFTSYRIKFLATLPTSYSIRLYEYLLMELNKSRKKELLIWVDVEVYKTMLNVGTKYTSMSDFLKRAIFDQVDFINNNEKSDLILTTTNSRGKRMYKKAARHIKEVGILVTRRV